MLFSISIAATLVQLFVIYFLNCLEAYKLVCLPLTPITCVHKVLLYFFIAYKINVKNPSLVCKVFHSMALVYLFHFISTSPPTYHHILHTHSHTHTQLLCSSPIGALSILWKTRHSAVQLIRHLLNVYYVPNTVLSWIRHGLWPAA